MNSTLHTALQGRTHSANWQIRQVLLLTKAPGLD